jgi:hypothetical protein
MSDNFSARKIIVFPIMRHGSPVEEMNYLKFWRSCLAARGEQLSMAAAVTHYLCKIKWAMNKVLNRCAARGEHRRSASARDSDSLSSF